MRPGQSRRNLQVLDHSSGTIATSVQESIAYVASEKMTELSWADLLRGLVLRCRSLDDHLFVSSLDRQAQVAPG